MTLFAVIPAAGHSRRMGRSKLTLPLAGQPVIQRLLRTLRTADLTCTVVVLRRDDDALASILRSADVTSDRLALIQPPTDPPDMRTSVIHAVEHLQREYAPLASDGWLLIPADHPVVADETLRQLIAAWQQSEADILLPVFEGQRGHPVLMRWNLTAALSRIPPDCGLNWLRQLPGVRVQRVDVSCASVLFDMDTPQDFERLEAWVRERETPP